MATSRPNGDNDFDKLSAQERAFLSETNGMESNENDDDDSKPSTSSVKRSKSKRSRRSTWPSDCIT